MLSLYTLKSVIFSRIHICKRIEVRIYTNKKRTWQHRIKQTIKNQRKTKVTIDKHEYKTIVAYKCKRSEELSIGIKATGDA